MPTLFRGITVSPDDQEKVVREIRDCGLVDGEAKQWRTRMPDPIAVRTIQKDLMSSPGTIRSRLNQELLKRTLVNACGDRYGGSYYALSHNRSASKTTSILIEFQAPLELLCVDGKDFLYTVFQRWDQRGAVPIDKVRTTLAALYGPKILEYFDEAALHKESNARVGICDLACHDLEVIRAHSENEILIRGRHNTRFCSAFQLQLPVSPESIIRIECNPTRPPEPAKSVSLDDVL